MGSTDEETHDGDAEYPPVSADWPRGFGESTWWPIVVVAGVTGIYLGVGLLVVASRPEVALGYLPGVVTFAGGLLAFLGGVAGWNYHGFVTSRRLPLSPGYERRFLWGVVLFVVAEIATFGSGLAYYAFVRVGPWPPGPLPSLLTSLLAVNTALLVTSSVLLHRAEGALGAGDRRRFLALLGGTVLLGLVFLAGQAYEYYELVAHEGLTLSEGVFASAFFGLTGLHGLHVGLGIVMLAVVLVRGRRGDFSPDGHAALTTASLYWHFVDAVWLVLVAVLYVGAVVGV